ncbi:unnamed protein product, partial [Oppiella nova]
MARYGATGVVVTGLDGDDVRKVAKDCINVSPNGMKPLEMITDFRREADIRQLVDTTIDTFGRIDILVNSAGMAADAFITDTDYVAKQRLLFDVNLNSVVLLTHYCVKHLEKTNGNIVNISSTGGLQPAKLVSSYSMSKAALNIFTQCMALELGGKGIRVNAVIPSLVDTNIARAGTVDVQRWFRSNLERAAMELPVGRYGQPIDIANAIIYLASDHATFVTGSIMLVDGGHIAGRIKKQL